MAAAAEPLHARWQAEQDRLRARLVGRDQFTRPIQRVAGVDISFDPDDADGLHCVSTCVLRYGTLELLQDSWLRTRLDAPYVPGFLAFREVPAIAPLLSAALAATPDLRPDVVLVDGNGTLHPRGFGLACHLGVVCDAPTIGVAKTLMCVDGVPGERDVRRQMRDERRQRLDLRDAQGRVRAAAILSTPAHARPIYVSAGHRVTLDSAVDIVRSCCLHRVPEPIRQADLRSRAVLRAARQATPTGPPSRC